MNKICNLLTVLMVTSMLFPNYGETRPKKKKEVSVSSVEASAPKGGSKFPFPIYTEKKYKAIYLPSGWMGDYGDIKVNDGATEAPRSGSTCVQIIYTAERKNKAGWAGVYWQYPANNWGNKQGGYDLTGAKKLVFWAKGAKGGETIAEFKVGGITGQTFPGDSDSASIGPIQLTNVWQKYQIDLVGKDLSNIIGGFAFSASADDNPSGFIVFLDDIYFD